jgi:hypothetical protein
LAAFETLASVEEVEQGEVISKARRTVAAPLAEAICAMNTSRSSEIIYIHCGYWAKNPDRVV